MRERDYAQSKCAPRGEVRDERTREEREGEGAGRDKRIVSFFFMVLVFFSGAGGGWRRGVMLHGSSVVLREDGYVRIRFRESII